MTSFATCLIAAAAAIACGASARAQSELYVLAGDAPQVRAGRSVAGAGDVDGDGIPDVIVGVYGDDVNGPRSGSARVVSGRDASILHVFVGDAADDFFGFAVAGAGDVDADGFADVIVGAQFNDANGVDSGLARVFSGFDGALLFELRGDSAGDHFGHAVAGAGDVDLDGFADVLVAANDADVNAVDAGSVSLFSGLDGALLRAWTGATAGDEFGTSLACAGDVDADGTMDVIVGAIGDDGPFVDAGSARVFSGVDGALLYTFDGAGPGVLFGWSVTGAGDCDGDGFADLAVGAPHDDFNGALAGSVHVYSGADGSLLRVQHGVFADELGYAVAVAGDTNGDGFDDLLASALGGDQGAPNAGSVYLVSGADGSVLHSFDGSASLDWFGASVAGPGDLNGDGYADIVIGAPQADVGGAESGAAFVFLSQCPAPLSYCTAKVNSQGCLPVITFSGAASLSVGDNFVVGAHDVLNNKLGFLVWGPNQASIPLGGGTLCLSSFVRTPVQDSFGNPPPNDCSGSYAFHFSHEYMSSHGFTPGMTRYAQFYSRDGGFALPNNIGLTDALEFVVCP